MSSSDEENVDSPQTYVEETGDDIKSSGKKRLKISHSIFRGSRSSVLSEATLDNPTPKPSQETRPTRQPKPYMCPKCIKYFDAGTDLVEHLHDHNNTGKDRIFRCKICNIDEQPLIYVHYEGYYYGEPNKRIIGVHCEECLTHIWYK